MAFATVIPEGLKLHRKSDFSSEIVTELAHGDRVKILQKRSSPGGTPLAEVMVSRTKTGIQVGMVGWVRESLLEIEVPAPLPPPPDVPHCDPIPETDPFPLGTYIVYGLFAVAGLAAIAWILNNI